ncbi:nuclear transport factor 2 family protein [Nocardioides sp. cx-169]|uniref:nuclear transport factor 2 family protein n=1 Tax=Nocardioides sp. cx-169 TaxID=2899080 RepID=UPI001E587B58|nr:nuclear transport factor 2 family protein [Nocardioides sp. cx-169]MCD4533659.1 nuclear transport factor 2 family protein [Nocardioides sp. cx-169]
MTSSSSPVDVLVIGAGVTGLHQLMGALDAGLSVKVLEAGHGVGGTWYWNRYPGARFDSESWTYGFLSEEIWREWNWKEQYAGQPEIEEYFNFAVDRLDLRRHIEFGAKVVSVVWDDASCTHTVTTEGGASYNTRFVVAASGNLSVPFIPEIPGRADFRGDQHHTGRWPDGVDLTGKRVAQIGTGSSGVQIVPAVKDQVAQITVYQMNADWVTPLNNGPLSEEERARIQRDYEEIVAVLNNSPSGFEHRSEGLSSTDHDLEQRRAFFEKTWNSRGFRKLTENYIDLTTNPEINREWCEFIADKIRTIVKDPVIAARLTPTDGGYGGRRPPFGTGYYEAYNNPNVDLVSLQETPIVRITPDGIETTEGHREFDVIIWATGWDFGTGALNRLGVRGRDGLALEDHWKSGPLSYLGIMTHGFPNFFFPGGPHGSTGNNPRYSGDQVAWTTQVIVHAREQGVGAVEATEAAEQQWTGRMNESKGLFLESSYFHGANIPGKPVAQLLNPTGRWAMQEVMREDAAAGYPALLMTGQESGQPSAAQGGADDVAGAVRNAIGAHTQAQDAGDAERIASLYLPDAVLALPGSEPLVGLEALRQAFLGWAPTAPQKHLVGNTVVTQVSDDEAHAVSDVVFFQRGESGWSVQVTGRYEDTLRRTADGWRFGRRDVQYTA